MEKKKEKGEGKQINSSEVGKTVNAQQVFEENTTTNSEKQSKRKKVHFQEPVGEELVIGACSMDEDPVLLELMEK